MITKRSVGSLGEKTIFGYTPTAVHFAIDTWNVANRASSLIDIWDTRYFNVSTPDPYTEKNASF